MDIDQSRDSSYIWLSLNVFLESRIDGAIEH